MIKHRPKDDNSIKKPQKFRTGTKLAVGLGTGGVVFIPSLWSWVTGKENPVYWLLQQIGAWLSAQDEVCLLIALTIIAILIYKLASLLVFNIQMSNSTPREGGIEVDENGNYSMYMRTPIENVENNDEMSKDALRKQFRVISDEKENSSKNG